MNKLKIKTSVPCNTCGDSLRAVKTFKVNALTLEAAKVEIATDVNDWQRKVSLRNCKVCQCIINDVGV